MNGDADNTAIGSGPGPLRVTHEAMAAVFTLLISHEDQRYAHQAAAAAWSECDRLERELSRFIENSDISRLNSLTLHQRTVIGVDAGECLRRCGELKSATKGAFDVTIGTAAPLPGAAAAPPFAFDPDTWTVTRLHPRAVIDLGGFAKGYAVDAIAGLLKEWEITSVLISGGRSSVLALEPPPGQEGWNVTVSRPGTREVLETLTLARCCLSGSGLQKGAHIINPATGEPVTGTRAAWALSPDASAGDALSTAFMVMDQEDIAAFVGSHPEYGAMILRADGQFVRLPDSRSIYSAASAVHPPVS